MIKTKRQPVSVGEILREEFIKPLNLTQEKLSKLIGVSRKTINELCNDRRHLTVETAMMFAKAFSTTPEFWMNIQQRNDIWIALNDLKIREHINHIRAVSMSSSY